jgi:O-antigen ligase
MLVGWLAGPLALLYTLPQAGVNKIFRFALLGLLGLSTLAIGLSFSRSAWIGFLAGGVILLLFGRRFNKWVTVSTTLVCTASLAFVAVSQTAALTPRLGGVKTQSESRSTLERSVLIKESLAMIRDKPLTGTGIGTFALAPIPGRENTPISEPVHNIPLLATSELGLLGGLVTVALGLAVVWGMQNARHSTALVFSAAVLGLFCIGLFDHYLWSQAPGRALLWLTMGVWASQTKAELMIRSRSGD